MLAEKCDYPLHLGVTEAGPDADGRREERGRDRHAARRGHRRHDPRLAHRRPGRRGQGRQLRSCSRSASASAGSTSSPARRAAAPRSTSSSSRKKVNAALEKREVHGADPRRRHGLRRERPRRGPRGRRRHRRGQRARLHHRQGRGRRRRSPRTSSSTRCSPRPAKVAAEKAAAPAETPGLPQGSGSTSGPASRYPLP